MFIENKEYEPFALEFKRCYKELISKLSEIWNEYDFEMGVGDPYAFPNYTKEEINTLLENKADSSHTHVVADIADGNDVVQIFLILCRKFGLVVQMKSHLIDILFVLVSLIKSSSSQCV